MEKNKLNLTSIFLLFICISSCFALLPSCYLEDKKCGLEANNLLSWDSSTDIETCRERCQNYQDPKNLTSICTIFTYFGPNSIPFENMCFILSSCPDIYQCEGCITESVQSCLCSLPHECYSGRDNILAILEGVPFEEACRQICFDTNKPDKPDETCTTYTFYDDESQESPRICVLHKGCEKISLEPCVGCHTGPRSCASSENEECNFAVWSPSMEAGVMVTENQTVTMMSGEQNCYKEVNALAIGGGGGALSFRGGGGSGYVANESFNVTAHMNLMVTVGNGGSENIPATASVVTYEDGTVVIKGAAGNSANSFNGSDGYSGGGAQGANGGENGGNGGNFGNSFGGHGEGSDVDLGSLSTFKYGLQPGEGGMGNNSIGGGGGGGVVVVVEEIEQSPEFNDYQGKGFGGGAGGYSETSGLSGCVILEL